MLKTFVLNIFVKTWSFLTVFTVTFDQFNASLLNKNEKKYCTDPNNSSIK